MKTTLLWTAARLRSRAPTRATGDRGEGVISTAIAVLIMAFLGAAMWFGFQQMWQTTSATTNHKVEQIGND
jgi:TRAP-type C4-dicarboxylate transport system permease small subunit